MYLNRVIVSFGWLCLHVSVRLVNSYFYELRSFRQLPSTQTAEQFVFWRWSYERARSSREKSGASVETRSETRLACEARAI